MAFIQTVFIVIFVLILPRTLSASEPSRDYILRIKPEVSKRSVKSFFSRKSVTLFESVEPLSEELGIYKVTFKGSNEKSMEALAENLSQDDRIKYIQPDHPVKLRSQIQSLVAAPNDPQFAAQWSLNQSSGLDIDALLAWDFGVGGVDALGNPIVVAVVDGGVDLTHEDLVNNIWINSKEIPGDGIDNDQNGYVDDINGWNAFTNTGAVASDMHGTHVSGILGAVGNNGKGIAGVNWNVGIMAVNGASGTTSIVLKAYGYVYRQKKLWLDTNGAKGAKVVATNSSFGVDYGDCNSSEYSAWNDIYEEMGRVGILSAVATANIAIDVDQVGDVPSGCTSPYIVTVTNTTAADRLYTSAGWGRSTIDIGAPGTQIFSSVPGNQYRYLTGTSMATPHITGAIAFLDSQVGRSISVLRLNSPGEVALAIKQAMLESVDPVADLRNKTVSGGRLNLYRATQRLHSLGY